MGRHRRTTAPDAAEGRTTAGTDPYYSHGTDDTWEVPLERPHRGGHRHRRRRSVAVRTGLLGVSAAVAVGVVAVTSGVLPGGDSFSLGGDGGSDRVRSAGTPSGLRTQGGTEGPAHTSTAHPDRATRQAPSPTAGSRSAHPSSGGSASHTAPHASRTAKPAPTGSKNSVTKTPSHTPTADPSSSAPGTPESAAAAEVLRLVNQERDKAGCSALSTDEALADLASAFSKQMADEGFFDHTDPEGRSPWDRAAKAGITNLGGENIARGQADAEAVMDSWMDSPGHRANILNCDYKTIGIGVHFGTGGPWWTQDFGF
ncbi:CAP domain-containing protein [Streptomyces odontomachi]|uniref:CAP domain-containing protein n=1 Tax=Streptomyces odontomachi TaxID=2944940 RepID=UPI00210A91CE|nr:CAP domain-containing protein [Streptomyces sp. ODS25]